MLRGLCERIDTVRISVDIFTSKMGIVPSGSVKSCVQCNSIDLRLPLTTGFLCAEFGDCILGSGTDPRYYEMLRNGSLRPPQVQA